MRIISGKHGGIRLAPPKNLPVRPTTDLSKEALFNILQNRFELSELSVLDLFAGTGNISFEFASRGCTDITAIDAHFGCCKFIADTATKLNMEGLNVQKADVFKYLGFITQPFDLIFADPPYDLSRIPELPDLVFNKQLINAGGWLIIEHASFTRLGNHPNFVEVRRYGQSSFSIFAPIKQ